MFDAELRKKWPKGPWDDEPDSEEWVHSLSGYKCQIRRGPLGNLCGYVSVPLIHPLVTLSYDLSDSNKGYPRIEESPQDLLWVHGGITYSRKEGSSWTFGFDTSHAGDLTLSIFLLPKHLQSRLKNNSDTYKTIQYVRDEVNNLVSQLYDYRNLLGIKQKASGK